MKNCYEFFPKVTLGNEYSEFCEQIAPSKQKQDNLRATLTCAKISQVTPLNKKSFMKKISEFYESITHKPIKQPINSLQELSEHSFVVAEQHSGINAKRWLIENMSYLRSTGFDTLYFEHLYYNEQKLLDEYHKTEILDLKIKKRLQKLDMGHGRISQTDRWDWYNFSAVVAAAKEADIRVVAIDIKAVYETQGKSKINHHSSDSNNRVAYMNYTAAQIIKHEESKRDKPGKWLALMGNIHPKYFFPEFPGVADILGVPTAYIFDSNNIESELAINSEIRIGTYLFKGEVIIAAAPDAALPQIDAENKNKAIP